VSDGPPRPRFWFLRTRVGRIIGVAALCYLAAFAAINLGSAPFGIGSFIGFIFPRVGPGLDQNSLNAEWGAIQREYVFRNVDTSLGTEGAANGMVEKLDQMFSDRFTAFLTKAEYAEQRGNLNGQRAGSIGIALVPRCTAGAVCMPGQAPSLVVIEDVLSGQPAQRAGLRFGDVLLAVNGRRLSSMGSSLDQQLDKVAPLIRGQPGTSVTLTVDRAGQTIDITARRADLSIPSVFTRTFGSVLYLQVTGFDTGTGEAAQTMLRNGLAAGATSVILDLRGNGGGFVSDAQKLASQFVAPAPGTQDVVVRRGRMTPDGGPASAQTVFHDRLVSGGVAYRQPLVVLVDGDSASASEIVTAALRDYHRATLVGVKTFGKGSVQVDFPLPDGSDLHLTVERWYGPNGESIDSSGITPDQVVPLPNPDDRFRLDAESPDPSADLQLQTALASLRG